MRFTAFIPAAFFAAFFVSSLFFPPLVRGEEVTPLGEVQVRSQEESPLPSKPSAFTTVLKPKSTEVQLSSLPELLSQQVGIHVQQFGGLGQLSTVSIRGSSAEQVTVLVDGVRLNTAQGGSVDFSNLPLEVVDRIEILRGGASAEFGSDAIGGVVNILTKKAKNKQVLQADLGGASFGTLKGHLGYSRPFKKWSLIFDHTHLQSRGDFTFQTTETSIGGATLGGHQEYSRENNAFFSENGLIKIDAKLSEKIHLSGVSDWFGSKREVPPTEEEYVLLSPANPPEAQEALLKNFTTFKLDLKSVLGSSLDLQFQPFYRFEYSHFLDPSPALGGAIDVKYLNQSYGAKLGATYEWKDSRPQPQWGHLFKWAYDFKRDQFEDENLNGSLRAGPHSRNLQAFYVSDQISFFNERLQCLPSLRYEYTDDFGSFIALHLGLTGLPLPWLRVKTNFGSSFRYPNFNELYFPNQGIVRGNPHLIPEEALNWDGGIQVTHRWGSHELSYFKNWIRNSIVFVPVSAFTIQPLNTREVRSQGLEFLTQLRPWRHLDLEGNYTLLLAHLESSGKQLPGRPRHKANAKLRLHNSWGSLWAAVQYVDQLPIDFSNSTFIRSRSQLDVGGSLKFLKYFTFSLEVKDLTNVQIFDARGFPLPRRSFFASLGVKI